MRSFPGERPLHAQSRPCKQAKQQHRASLALTSFTQHRSINSGDLAALLGRISGMVRRYGGHARYTAAGIRFRSQHASSPLANAISCRRWLKLDLSAGLCLAPSSRDAGEYLRAAKLSRVSRVGWLCVLYKRSLILHTDYHHRCNHHQHKHAVIAVSISIIVIICIIVI